MVKKSKKRMRQAAIFNKDIKKYSGYLYTQRKSLSSRLATNRSLKAILDNWPDKSKKVIDIGGGDGYFVRMYARKRKTSLITSIDLSGEAIRLAKKRNIFKNRLKHLVADGHNIPFADNCFDLALLQSILHHDDDPGDLVKEAFRVAPKILIHEPNGNNLGLKIIEKTSKYHKEHKEKSYSTNLLIKIIENAGGKVDNIEFAGFVPMFYPDILTKIMRTIEPVVEKIPGVRNLFCAVVVISASRSKQDER